MEGLRMERAAKFVLRFAAYLPAFVGRCRRERMSLKEFGLALLAVEETLHEAIMEPDAGEAEKIFSRVYLFP